MIFQCIILRFIFSLRNKIKGGKYLKVLSLLVDVILAAKFIARKLENEHRPLIFTLTILLLQLTILQDAQQGPTCHKETPAWPVKKWK